jgi:hypothetical protein
MVLFVETFGANDALEVIENTKMAKMEARTTEVCIFSLSSRSTSRTKRDAGQLRAYFEIRGIWKLEDELYGGGTLDQRKNEETKKRTKSLRWGTMEAMRKISLLSTVSRVRLLLREAIPLFVPAGIVGAGRVG